ncbi:MAG: hypothetical protein QOG20_3955, partial [Pseudonocardiales bacterium]|nr:hypothetical protein [Pseudonocardiales bacterium]
RIGAAPIAVTARAVRDPASDATVTPAAALAGPVGTGAATAAATSAGHRTEATVGPRRA